MAMPPLAGEDITPIATRSALSGGRILPLALGLDVVIIEQNPIGRAVQILELTRPQCPKKSGEPQSAKDQCHWNQHQEIAHQTLLDDRRNALVMTITDEVDIEMAAISGVTIPMTAIGMVKTL